MAATDRIGVTIAVEDDVADDLQALHAVLQRLVTAGLESAEAQEALGTITGEVRTDLIAQLERVAGVSAVERGRTISVLDKNSERP